MPKGKSTNRLERWEISIVKAMLDTGEHTDQVILAYFTRPNRSINHARIAEIRSGKKHKTVAAASKGELLGFQKSWPRIDWNTGLNLIGDELLIKAREAMLQAVQTYNNPRAQFRSELFIVAAVIAWTYLLHAFYRSKGVDYRHYRRRDGKLELMKTKHGAEKHWELETCLEQTVCPLDDPTKSNLLFLIAIRHEIEHQMTRQIDAAISAKLQACCLNFNRVIKELFGAQYGLEGELSFALQFASIGVDQRNQLLKESDLPQHLVATQTEFETHLSDDVVKDPRYAYRIALVQKTVNSKGKADEVIEFIRPESEEAQQISRILLKETERKKFKPGQIISLMRKDGFKKFREHEHTQLWKVLDAKDPKKGFGVHLREGDWWWYENWIDRVRQHCQENTGKYS